MPQWSPLPVSQCQLCHTHLLWPGSIPPPPAPGLASQFILQTLSSARVPGRAKRLSAWPRQRNDKYIFISELNCPKLSLHNIPI